MFKLTPQNMNSREILLTARIVELHNENLQLRRALDSERRKQESFIEAFMEQKKEEG